MPLFWKNLELVVTCGRRCSLLVLLSLLACLDCEAQESDAPARLKGLSREQVERQLGPPDAKEALSGRRESWNYGKSIVFFKKGEVNAWSNAGELEGRRNLAKIREGRGSEYDRYSTSWINAWTPTKKVPADTIIEELMESADRDLSAEAGEPAQSSKSKSSELLNESTSSSDGSESNTSLPRKSSSNKSTDNES